jgi:hypothetical protein
VLVADVEELLSEHPEAHGFTVPGMPTGSPDMEMPEKPPDSYEVTSLVISKIKFSQIMITATPLLPK